MEREHANSLVCVALEVQHSLWALERGGRGEGRGGDQGGPEFGNSVHNGG